MTAAVLRDAKSIASSAIVRGGLITETWAVLRSWQFDASEPDNFNRLLQHDVTGAVSESWRRDILGAVRRRLSPGESDAPLTVLAQAGMPLETWKPLLLWHITRNEFLLRDFLSGFLWDEYSSGSHHVQRDAVVKYLSERRIQSKLKRPWGSAFLRRTANGLLQIATDFGFLTGTLHKEFASYHLPEESFIYLLHAMADVEPNARRIVDAEDWHMYLMDTADVERELLRLHQFRKVHYEVAGSLAQLKLPHGSSADYARELCA